jgi:osmoprotectant transport system ATP-binding protein
MNDRTISHGAPVVELRGVSKSFGDAVKAVDDARVTVFSGETVALLGPSGCGKTTTLRLINRLTEVDAGEVLVRGTPVREQNRERLRRSIGYVIQDGGLFPHLTVADNTATLPRLLRWSRTRTEERVAEVLELVGLPIGTFGHRKPEALSGGQRQRVGVARALCSDPDLLLMDEPFSALDPVTRETLQDEFIELQQRLHKTVVIVSHDMLEAGKLSTRIVMMNHGSVVQQGTVAQLLFHPADAFVRGFLGRHKQQMIFDTLRVDDLLDEIEPLASPGRPDTAFRGNEVLRRVLAAITNVPTGGTFATESGRHQGNVFSVDGVRQILFQAADE